MRNALCHLSISAASLQQGASFVITLVKLLICHPSMMRWADRSKRLHRRRMNEEGGGGGFNQRECLRRQLYINRDGESRPTAWRFIIILTCGQSIIRILLSSPWPVSSAPPPFLPQPTPTVADDIVTLITANCSALNGFSHIANDTPLVSVTMFPQKNSMGTGNLHK